MQHLIERISRVPHSTREFTVSPDDAMRIFGIDGTALARLANAGLPYEIVGNERKYDEADLHFVGLRLGTAEVALVAARLMAKTLVRLTGIGSARFRVAYTYRGAAPGRAVVALPGDTSRELWAEPHAELAVVEAPTELNWPEVPPALSAVADAVGRLEWYRLRGDLVGDPDFSYATDLTECLAAAEIVRRRCVAEGYEARASWGLALAAPRSIPHAWTEVHLDGVWRPLDPFLLTLLRDFGGLPPAEWPLSRSPGAILLRVSELPIPFLSVDGSCEPIEFSTRLERGPVP